MCAGENSSCAAELQNFSSTMFYHIEANLTPCSAYVATIHAFTEAGAGPAKKDAVVTTSQSIAWLEVNHLVI